MLIALYTLIFVLENQGVLLFIDKPDNFLALWEIQPWLIILDDAKEFLRMPSAKNKSPKTAEQQENKGIAKAPRNLGYIPRLQGVFQRRFKMALRRWFRWEYPVLCWNYFRSSTRGSARRSVARGITPKLHPPFPPPLAP